MNRISCCPDPRDMSNPDPWRYERSERFDREEALCIGVQCATACPYSIQGNGALAGERWPDESADFTRSVGAGLVLNATTKRFERKFTCFIVAADGLHLYAATSRENAYVPPTDLDPALTECSLLTGARFTDVMTNGSRRRWTRSELPQNLRVNFSMHNPTAEANTLGSATYMAIDVATRGSSAVFKLQHIGTSKDIQRKPLLMHVNYLCERGEGVRGLPVLLPTEIMSKPAHWTYHPANRKNKENSVRFFMEDMFDLGGHQEREGTRLCGGTVTSIGRQLVPFIDVEERVEAIAKGFMRPEMAKGAMMGVTVKCVQGSGGQGSPLLDDDFNVIGVFLGVVKQGDKETDDGEALCAESYVGYDINACLSTLGMSQQKLINDNGRYLYN